MIVVFDYLQYFWGRHVDLQEEYYLRRHVDAHMVKYVERGSVILKARNGRNTDCKWLHAQINYHPDNGHPGFYMMVTSANPIIWAAPDFSNFSFQYTKTLIETRMEWDQYEQSVINWAERYSKDYYAISRAEAVLFAWEMFLCNYDAWMANFLPWRMVDWLAHSLNGEIEERNVWISKIEEWMEARYERLYSCWRNVCANLDTVQYCDWLVKIVNNIKL